MKHNFYRISNVSKYLPLFSDSPHFRFVAKCNDYGNASTNVFSIVISSNRNLIVRGTKRRFTFLLMQSKEQTKTHSIPAILTISINDWYLFGFLCKILVHYFYLKNSSNFYYCFYYSIYLLIYIYIISRIIKIFWNFWRAWWRYIRKDGITRDIKNDGNNKRYGRETMKSKHELV